MRRSETFIFRSPAAFRARSWRRLRRGSQRPSAWLAAMRHFGRVPRPPQAAARSSYPTRRSHDRNEHSDSEVPNLTGGTFRAGEPKLGDHGRHAGHGDIDRDAPAAVTAITAPAVPDAPRGRVTKARRITAVMAGTIITAVTARAMRIPITAVTAVTAGPCPLSERHAAAGSWRGHGGHGGHGVSRPASQRIGDPQCGWPG